MYRIRKGSCGYQTGTYTCQGISELNPVFSAEDLVADTNLARPATDAGLLEDDTNWIDNYLNIPIKFAGMRMTMAYIPDMGADIVKTVTANKQLPPELVCNTTLNPVTFAGMLDLFTTIYQEETVARQAIEPDATHYPLATTLLNWIDTEHNNSEYTFYPPMLEPMLDTSFPPLDVYPLPTIDLTLDGIVAALILLTKWRIIVEKILNDLLGWNKYLNALRFAMSTPAADCGPQQLRIQKASGDSTPESGWNKPARSPRYTCTGGTVYINGQSYSVAALTTPETVGTDDGDELSYYLKITFSGTSQGATPYQAAVGYGSISVSLTTTATHNDTDVCIRIGGVRLTYNKKTKNRRTFFVYKRDIAMCMIDIDVVRTPNSGVLIRDGRTYRTLGTALCNTTPQQGAGS